MIYTVEPFRAEHFAEIVESLDGRSTFVVDPMPAARYWETKGPAFTARYEGRIVGCAGLVVVWPGVAEAWAAVAPVALVHPVASHRLVKRGLDAAIRTLKLHRVHADVEESFDRSRRWMKALGFREESRMPKFGPRGETYVRYVRFVEEA